MKKNILIMTFLFLATGVFADSLANALSPKESQETKMVNLDNLKVGKEGHKKSDVVAVVGSKKITKEEVDQYLGLRTQGHAVDFDKLEKKEQKGLIEEMAIPLLAAQKAEKEFTKDEKERIFANVIARAWMQKVVSDIKVTDKESKAMYDKIVKLAKSTNKEAQIPTFEKVKEEMKMQVAQEKVAQNLIKDAKIELK